MMHSLTLFLAAVLWPLWQAEALDFWEPTNGPYGGRVTAITITPAGYIFAGTADNGVFLSTDNGDRWTQAGLLDTYIFSLASNSEGDIFAGTGVTFTSDGQKGGGIYSSLDDGRSWKLVGLDSINVWSIFASPSQKDLIFVGTSDGIYLSKDNGNTWTRSVSLIPVHSFAIDPNGNILAGFLASGTAGGVFRSTDNGVHWTRLGLEQVASLAVDSKGNIFAGTWNDGIFRSVDDGSTWIQINRGLEELSVKALLVHPNDYILAAAGRKIVRSVDQGDTWVLVSDVLPVENFAMNTAGDIYAAVQFFRGGVYRSTDKGESWRRVGAAPIAVYSLDINSAGHIFAVPVDGIFRSIDRGITWLEGKLEWKQESQCFSSNSVVAVAPFGNVFYGTCDALFRSEDNGKNFVQVYRASSGDITALAVNSQGHIFAGTSNAEIFRSVNQGVTWAHVGLRDAGTITALAISPGEHIFATNLGIYPLYRSTNNGDSWTLVNKDLPEFLIINTIAFNSAGHIFVGTDGNGIFRSLDNGDTWIQVGQGISTKTVLSLAVNSTGDIFAGTDSSGIFRSTDNGENWTEVNSGLTDASIYSLAIDANGYVFAGTAAGVFRSVQSTTSVKEKADGVPTSFALGQNYPNPFNPETEIHFALPKAGHVTLKIINILGGEVRTLVDKQYDVGYHQVHWDGKDENGKQVASGIYLYQLQTGSFSLVKKMSLLR